MSYRAVPCRKELLPSLVKVCMSPGDALQQNRAIKVLASVAEGIASLRVQQQKIQQVQHTFPTSRAAHTQIFVVLYLVNPSRDPPSSCFWLFDQTSASQISPTNSSDKDRPRQKWKQSGCLKQKHTSVSLFFSRCSFAASMMVYMYMLDYERCCWPPCVPCVRQGSNVAA